MMDPIGFKPENFDGIGKWRTAQCGQKLDASGQLTDGTKIDGVASLRQALVRYSPQFVRTLTEKLLIYALGRGSGISGYAGGSLDCARRRPQRL